MNNNISVELTQKRPRKGVIESQLYNEIRIEKVLQKQYKDSPKHRVITSLYKCVNRKVLHIKVLFTDVKIIKYKIVGYIDFQITNIFTHKL